MQFEAYVEALREDLARIGAVGDESTARTAEILAAAIEPSVARRLQEALAEAALELSAQLEGGRVELRVAADDLDLVYVHDEPQIPAESTDQGLTARITLRLPETLKSRLEAAAAADGISVNAWLVQALSRRLEPRQAMGGSRHRLTGYGQT